MESLLNTTTIGMSAGIALVIVVLAISLYYAFRGVVPGASLYVETKPPTSNGMDANTAKFMMFYTTWCPYSKKAQQPWASFKQMMKNTPKTYGGKSIMFEEINAEADEGKAALYNVQAYPTFKLETDSKVYQMIGKPEPATFRAFLMSALGKESS
jgi:thiol-disulfide isomerase/thioredoxin